MKGLDILCGKGLGFEKLTALLKTDQIVLMVGSLKNISLKKVRFGLGLTTIFGSSIIVSID